MTISGAGFAVTGALLVIAALAVVALPSPRHSLYAALAATVAAALVLAVAGSPVVAVGEVVVVCGIAAVAYRLAPADQRQQLLSEFSGVSRSWPVGLAIGLVITAGLVATLIARRGELAAGHHGGYALLTLIHWREPIAALLGLALVVVSISTSLLVARHSDDERSADASREQRRRQQQRRERRREDREEARRRRGVDVQ